MPPAQTAFLPSLPGMASIVDEVCQTDRLGGFKILEPRACSTSTWCFAGRWRRCDAEGIMASGHVNRAEQAEHMAAPTNAAEREESPCQLGAVHTWP